MKIFQNRKGRMDRPIIKKFSYFSLYICLFITSFLANLPAYAQNCSSNDVQIIRAYLIDAATNMPLEQQTPCTYGTVIKVKLALELATNTPRKGVSISGLIVEDNSAEKLVGDVGECFPATLSAGTTVRFTKEINWVCGTAIKLVNTGISWGTGNSQYCTGTDAQAPSTPSKCWKQADNNYIPVVTYPCATAGLSGPVTSMVKCVGETARLTTSFTAAANTQVTSVTWQYSSNGGTSWSNLPNSSSNTVSTTNFPATTGTTALTINDLTGLNGYQYRAQVTSTSKSELQCTVASSATTLTVNTASTDFTSVSASPLAICSGGSSTLSATGGTVGTGAATKWYTDAAGNSALGSTTVRPTQTTTYYVRREGTCGNTAMQSVTVTVSPITVGGSVGSTQTVCSGSQPANNLILSNYTGDVVRWEKSTNEGFTTGTVTTISNTTNILTAAAIGTLSQDTWFRAVVKSGVCNEVVSGIVKITVNQPPTTATVGNTQNLCGTLTSNALGGNTPSVGTGSWSKMSGPGDVTFSAVNSGSSTATVTVAGTYVMKWTVGNGVCNPSSATITVNYYATPSNPSVSVVSPTCTSANGTVTVTAPLDGDGIDYEYSNNGGTYQDDVTFTVAAGANYSITARRKVNETFGCISVAKTGTMASQPQTPGQPTATVTQQPTCATSTGTITVSNPNSNYTYILSPNPLNIAYNNGSFSGLGAGDYTVTAMLNSCSSAPSTTATVNAIQSAPASPVVSITSQPSICGPTTGSVTVTCPTNPVTGDPVYQYQNGNGAWQTSPVFSNIAAGAGFSIKVRRISDISCVSEATTCASPGAATCEAEITSLTTQTSTSSIQTSEQPKPKEDQLTAYPIPFSENVTLEFKAEQEGNYEINLYDMKGTLIRKLKAGTAKAGEVTQIEVDGRLMAEGMYLARMVSNSGAKTVKLLKKK